MATTTTITKMLLRRGNDSDRKNTILASGEPGWTLDTKRLWIGDGQTPGGYPALSAAEEFFTYDDGTTPCVLRLNIGDYEKMQISDTPSLAQILASTAGGPDNQESYFHPTDRNIKTGHDINLIGNRAGGKQYINGSESLHVHQGNTNGGKLILGASNGNLDSSIGGRPYIEIQNSGDGGAIRIKCKDFQITSETSTWADAEHTLFEDPTIDINVEKDNGQITAPQTGGQSAHTTGIHIAHYNFLSAGNIMVGTEGIGEDAIVITPPEYNKRWAKNLDNVRDVTGKSNKTNNWIYGDSTYTYKYQNTTYTPGNGMDWSPSKPIVFRSARPSDYAGNANMVLESGLIVYGDDSGNDLNAYRINQNLDTRATVTFKGINIKNDDGSNGTIDVSSGGTGSTSFTKNAVITTLGNGSSVEPLKATTMAAGELLGGSNGGVKVISLTHAGNGTTKGIKVQPTASTGNITIENTFMPSFFDPTDVDSHFSKFQTIAADNKSFACNRHDEAIKIIGSGWIDTSLNDGDGSATISILHDYKGNFTNFPEAQAIDDMMKIGHHTESASTPGKDGRVINSLTIDTAGHVVNADVINHDDRYAMVSPKDPDTGAPIGSQMGPANGNITAIPSTASTNYTVNAAGLVTNSQHIDLHRVFANPVMGAYGTVTQYQDLDLHSVFASHKGVDKKISNALGTIDSKDTWLQLGAVGTQDFAASSSSKINFKNRPLEFKSSDEHFRLECTSSGLKLDHVTGNGCFSSSESYMTLDADDYTTSTANSLKGGLRIHRKKNGDKYVELRHDASINGWYSYGADSSLISDEVTISSKHQNAEFNVPFYGTGSSMPSRVNYQRYSKRIYGDSGFAYNPATNTLTAGNYKGNISGTTGVNPDIQSAIASGQSTTAQKVTINSAADSSDIEAYIVFDMNVPAGIAQKLYKNTTVDEGLIFNPKTGTFFSKYTSGTVLWARSGRIGGSTLCLNDSSGNWKTKGDVIGFYSFSDKRLKKDITTLDSSSSLDKILQLQGVSYKWKGKEGVSRGKQLGLIAQDVEKVVPEVVSTATRVDDETEYKRIDYDKLVPVLIESIKELTAKVEKLESQLK